MGHKLLETKHSVFHGVHNRKKKKKNSIANFKRWVKRERVTKFRVGERILKNYSTNSKALLK